MEGQHSFCAKLLEENLTNNPLIIFLLDALKNSGCPLDKAAFKCVPCDGKGGESGSFDPPSTILICQDVIQSSYLPDTLAHELIHAYDYCRVEFDVKDCQQVACTEIRAANLSGDCKWSRELMRGNFNLRAQHQKCVERRATLSLAKNKACEKCDIQSVIRKVWQNCLNDTEPFIDIP